MHVKEGVRQAMEFAQELHAKQTRKGKDVPYITHLARVVLILREVITNRDILMAAWLHDSVEDTGISLDVIKKRWGSHVARMVEDVTEKDKSLPWDIRKSQAVEHVRTMPRDSLLLKTADVIANTEETTEDFRKDGERVFANFNSPKAQQLLHKKLLVETIEVSWSENPLLPRLKRAYAEFLKTCTNS